MEQAGGLWLSRTRKKTARGEERTAASRAFFFFSILHFILRFEKKPRSGPPTANCLQCCSKFVQPQFDFGGWRGNRIVDDFSFGCTAGGLSASVLSPLPPFFFSSPPRLFFPPFLFPPSERDVCVPPTQAHRGSECRRERKQQRKKSLQWRRSKTRLSGWVSHGGKTNRVLAGKIS